MSSELVQADHVVDAGDDQDQDVGHAGRLPKTPGRGNAADECDPDIEADRDDLPAHIVPCRCETHDGFCKACNFKITVGSSGTEYGHARSRNRRGRTGGPRQDCKHRPDAVNPSKPGPGGTSSGEGTADG